MIFWLILVFLAGVYVGYKYPEQVAKAVESGQKMYNDFKDKLTKKEEPPSQ